MLIPLYLFFFLTVNLLLAEKVKRKLVQVLPVSFSIFVLLLYLLAFANHMWFADYFALAGSIVSICLIVRKKERKIWLLDALKQLVTPSFLVFCFVSAVGMFALSDRGITGFDEWNFWAVDIKSVFTLQGYAAKGLNCSPAYGDYPPGVQLIAAWTMHVFGKYDEGIMLSGYFLAMQIYLAPLLLHLPKKLPVCIGAFFWMFIIFSFGPNVMTDRAPDILMGIVYGCALVLIFKRERLDRFYYLGIAAVLAVLVLTKSIGIQWAVFAIFLFMMLHFGADRRNAADQNILWLLFPLGIYGSWQIFCKVYERTTYLVDGFGRTIKGISDNELFRTYGGQLLKAFFQGLFKRQQTSVLGIGLSVFACLSIYVFAVWLWHKKGILSRPEYKWIVLFVAGSGLLEYSILLFSVETMFLGEYGLYTNVDNMVLLLKRYGCPYVMGTLMLLLSILFGRIGEAQICLKSRWGRFLFAQKRGEVTVWLAAIAAGILLSPVEEQWKKYISYRQDATWLEKDINERTPKLVPIIDDFGLLENPYRQKVWVLLDGAAEDREFYDALYIRYYAAPMAVAVETYTEERLLDLQSSVDANQYTVVYIVSENPNRDIFASFQTENGENLKGYTAYYVKKDTEGRVVLAE